MRHCALSLGFVLWILFVNTATTDAKRQLRFTIYNYIPDVDDMASQTLLDWIETSFERLYNEIDLIVSKPWLNTYDVEEIRKLFENNNAPHIIEIDAVILDELVDSGLLARIDPEDYDLHVEGAYLQFPLQAIQHNGIYYGVPTLICGYYLMGINVGDTESACPLQNGVNDFTSLMTTLNQCKNDFLMDPRTVTMLGNFRGSFTLSHIYIDAYIDHHGGNSVYEAINSNINAETDVTNALKSFLQYCQETNQISYADTKCLNGEAKKGPIFTGNIVRGTAVTAYSSSERIGQHIKQDKEVNAYNIIAPPLGPQNNLLMYTDALVINKALYSQATEQDIRDFIRFFSSLSTRLSIAFGDDLPGEHPPRYLMQARKDFYDAPRVTSEPIYVQLANTLPYSVAGPNRLLYNERHRMEKTLLDILDVPTSSSIATMTSAQKCELLSFQHPREWSTDLEHYAASLKNTSGLYWETSPNAKSDLICLTQNSNSAYDTSTSIVLLLIGSLQLLMFLLH